MEIFIKNAKKTTHKENFKEALKVKNNMLGMKGNLGVESSKDKSNLETKLVVTKAS